MTLLKNVTLYRTGLILVLSAGVGMITIAPMVASAQDRTAQSQDKRQSGDQKPSAGHANKGQRPQQQARPQQARPAQSRPAQQHARPAQTRPATQPSRPQPSRPQPGHNTRPTPGHNTRPAPQPSRPGHNNGRPTTQPNRPNPGRPGTGRPNPGRPQTRPSRPQSRPNYQFRSQDTSRLRQYYRGGFGRINRRNRPRFYHGGYIPRTYWGDFQPVPYSLIGYLPAVPPGYAIGYYDGYVVVYDPTTYLILSVLDILQ